MGGKNRKKKNQKINIEDIKEAQEDAKLEKKLKNETKLNVDFFAIDTVGSTKGLSKSVRKAYVREKIPKSLKPVSKEGLKQIDRVVAKMDKKKAPEKENKPGIYDLWDEPENMSVTQKVKKPVDCKIGEKTCKAPAVVVADPGQAINPSPNAHRELIFRAAAQDIMESNEQKELGRRIKPMTGKLIDEYGYEAVQEMDEEEKLAKFHELTASKLSSVEEEAAMIGKKERKTTAQRNKREKHKELLREQSDRKRQKTLAKSVEQVPSMLSEMKNEEERRKDKKEYVESLKKITEEEEKKGVVTKPVKMGRIAFRESALDVPQGENTTLRQVKPTMAVVERINSIYRRNLVEQRSENSRLTLKRLQLQTRKKVKGKKFVSSLQRSLMLT